MVDLWNELAIVCVYVCFNVVKLKHKTLIRNCLLSMPSVLISWWNLRASVVPFHLPRSDCYCLVWIHLKTCEFYVLPIVIVAFLFTFYCGFLTFFSLVLVLFAICWFETVSYVTVECWPHKEIFLLTWFIIDRCWAFKNIAAGMELANYILHTPDFMNPFFHYNFAFYWAMFTVAELVNRHL